MQKVSFFVLSFILCSLNIIAQKVEFLPSKPKLVIGLVIDQMRWDYLKKYENLYITGGFKRLSSEGFNCNNTTIPYIPTYTAPGHSSIYTGSIPAFNGIVGNDWYERSINKNIYCTSDSTVTGVGTTSVWGKMSPRNMWATTIGDELRLSNNFKSKVIGISLKDRASILPAGHSANAAYWYDETVGGFISSSYYLKELPSWVADFNKKDYPGEYMKKDWDLLIDPRKYIQSTSDNIEFSDPQSDGSNTSFPHRSSEVITRKYDAFRTTPFANSYILNFAKLAIENEHLGANSVTDFLTVSISSTDYIGHKYGPNSLEIQDTYLRLDRDIASFLLYLDSKIGKGNYSIFLTADHGVSNVPAFLAKHRIPSGFYKTANIQNELNTLIENKFQIKKSIAMVENSQVYLSPLNDVSFQTKIEIKREIIQYLLNLPFVLNAVSLNDLGAQTIPQQLKEVITNGYNPKRSGDIAFIPKPFVIESYYENSGTTHGSWNLYDAHIPLIFFGNGFNKGNSSHRYSMIDIAATITSMLKIQMPDACIGNVIEEAIKKN